MAATGGTGTGATVTLTDNLAGAAQRGRTTRRMRGIEIVFDGGLAQIGAVRLVANSTLRLSPFASPRLMVMQESYGQVFLDYAGGQ